MLISTSVFFMIDYYLLFYSNQKKNQIVACRPGFAYAKNIMKGKEMENADAFTVLVERSYGGRRSALYLFLNFLELTTSYVYLPGCYSDAKVTSK